MVVRSRLLHALQHCSSAAVCLQCTDKTFQKYSRQKKCRQYLCDCSRYLEDIPTVSRTQETAPAGGAVRGCCDASVGCILVLVTSTACCTLGHPAVPVLQRRPLVICSSHTAVMSGVNKCNLYAAGDTSIDWEARRCCWYASILFSNFQMFQSNK